MKNKLLKAILMLSKSFLYGFVLQSLLFNFGFAFHANGQYKSIEEVTVRLSQTELTINQFFKEVRSQTPFRFSYDSRAIRKTEKLVFEGQQGTVENLLISVSKQSDLSFRQINNTIDVIKNNNRSIVPLSAMDTVTVSGTVTDEESVPLPGATVSVLGTSRGTITDIDGQYSIQVPDEASLVFSYIGFQSQTVEMGNQTTINVTLMQDASALEEVVVVGYAEQRKLSVTGAVSSVESKELRQSSAASLANALAGRLPGLTSIQSGGGQPGRDDATLYLRGAATTNGRSPLILIDGVPRDNIRTLD
ncbi:MAG: carboxypeptidase-like regulatory domain-containing protein, partial [Cyclobacteriaceae bacterium]